jgi:hypothetical protein
MKTNYSSCGMSAHAAWENAQKVGQSGQPTRAKSLKLVSQQNGVSSGEFLSIDSRFCVGYSELP